MCRPQLITCLQEEGELPHEATKEEQAKAEADDYKVGRQAAFCRDACSYFYALCAWVLKGQPAARHGKGSERTASCVASCRADSQGLPVADVLAAVQARKRSLGNIRFIGFLFVQKLLSERIMHTCIQQLLTNVCPSSLHVPAKLHC